VTLVALSATYGSGGSRIAPALAERLGVPLLDRARPVLPTERLDELLVAREPEETSGRPQLSTAAALGLCWGTPAGITLDALLPDDEERRATERAVRERAATGEGVILGRAATVLLREDPRVLHVRLDGPVERRVRLAAELEGIDEADARRRLELTDRARYAIVDAFYGVDISSPRLYALVLDSTAMSVDASVELLARAAVAWDRSPSHT
jgi:Cytidylate kinase-like family